MAGTVGEYMTVQGLETLGFKVCVFLRAPDGREDTKTEI